MPIIPAVCYDDKNSCTLHDMTGTFQDRHLHHDEPCKMMQAGPCSALQSNGNTQAAMQARPTTHALHFETVTTSNELDRCHLSVVSVKGTDASNMCAGDNIMKTQIPVPPLMCHIDPSSDRDSVLRSCRPSVTVSAGTEHESFKTNLKTQQSLQQMRWHTAQKTSVGNRIDKAVEHVNHADSSCPHSLQDIKHMNQAALDALPPACGLLRTTAKMDARTSAMTNAASAPAAHTRPHLEH